ncbi:hypothetical protein ABVC38_04015 [Lactobacillus iners]|uniref:hypothetical protein n=1 Tax=Lactobacillus iners TaxID=147802 RepID=UPI001F09BA03|nr:hypothetical protein [Lactobacillus iners]MCT7670066.1 hypothetical protein [Lactobacillus iners]MCT7685176.1 hypothetical protein [Lactobacillus iners]MCT7735559.1 hypothetical protein [Lactobacillus iners]MCT7737197.1 hypothetical protein [Lactobacillus iners]MCT7771437.1 hypothetical protein [Lactobacillus iners]
MGNNNLKEKIKNARKSGGAGKFKNLYWWVIDLENEVDIYGIKYNKIFLMPYTFGLTEDDLNTNISTDIIDLKNYEENDELFDEEGNNLFYRISKQKNYKKAKIHSNNYNVDITTGNFHPHDALKGVIKEKEIKQIMLVRNTYKNGSHYGVLYGKNNCPKGEEKNFIALRDEANKFYYIPKKCIKLVKENEEPEKTLNDFLNAIGAE